MRNPWTRLLALVLLLPLASAGCATLARLDPRRPHVSRGDALERCMKEVPPETPLYADAFSACMEHYGWVHGSPGRSEPNA